MEQSIHVQRIAAFSDGGRGGNPAGIALLQALPDAATMQRVAAEVGFSETAFAAPDREAWRVRYFAPAMEVPFCGHATIALGAALALVHGDGVFPLRLNDTAITVEGHGGASPWAALQSPPASSRPVPETVVARALALFGYTTVDLDPGLPPALAEAGARHLVLALRSRAALAAMHYDMAAGQRFMASAGLVTVSLVHAENPVLFHARNAFAVGGVYEDPATGAAAAALGGYLREAGWPHDGAIEIIQGEDMGIRSRLRAEITPLRGAGVRVVGEARIM